MRTYGKNFAFKKTATYKQRQTRLDSEWDIRIDVNDSLSIETILENIRKNLDDFQYVCVSGIEDPDIQPTLGCATQQQALLGGWRSGANQYGSKDTHVHLAVVLFGPMSRNDVLRLCRGNRKITDEYCAPRNRKFTYAGWILHHSKPGFKVVGEPGLRYEYGTLPLDPYTTECAMKVSNMIKKFGSEGMNNRFKQYTDLINQEKIKSKIEGLLMQLEDHDVE